MLNNCIGKSMPKDFLAIRERYDASYKRKDCSFAAMNLAGFKRTGANAEPKTNKVQQ